MDIGEWSEEELWMSSGIKVSGLAIIAMISLICLRSKMEEINDGNQEIGKPFVLTCYLFDVDGKFIIDL